ARAGEEVVRGKWRKMRGNLRITNLASRPMLLPVWIMAYRYRDQVFRFLADGQSGRSTGQAPVSYRKIGAAIAVAAIIILLILLWLLAASGGFRRRRPRWNRFSRTVPNAERIVKQAPVDAVTRTSVAHCVVSKDEDITWERGEPESLIMIPHVIGPMASRRLTIYHL